MLEEALRYDPADPLSNLESADVLDRGAAHGGSARKLVVPPRGCAVAEEPRRVVAALRDLVEGAGRHQQARGQKHEREAEQVQLLDRWRLAAETF